MNKIVFPLSTAVGILESKVAWILAAVPSSGGCCLEDRAKDIFNKSVLRNKPDIEKVTKVQSTKCKCK